MDASDLRVFEAVARLASMSRAAEALHTVQSNVTARIRALEEELGVPLFHRTNRGVTMTAAGRRLLPYTAIVARVLADASRAARDAGTPAGPLVIGCLETTAAVRLSPVLAAYSSRYPEVDLTLRTGTTEELTRLVLDRELDGAFVCGPVEHPDLNEETMFEEELVVLTAPGVSSLDSYLARPNLKAIVLRAGCSYRLLLEAGLAKRGVVGFKLLEFGTLESIFNCVSAGLGLTLLPRSLLGTAWPEERVAVHRLPGGTGTVTTTFVRRRDALVTSAQRAFLDLAAQSFRMSRAAAE